MKNVADIKSGGTPDTTNSNYWGGNIQWFTPSEVGNSKYVDKSLETITDFGLQKSNAKMIKKGSILLTTRAKIGECSITTTDCCTNQGFQSLIPNSKINNEFLYYLIQTKKQVLYKFSSGSTFNEISNHEIGKIDISYPKFDEQQKIANFLTLIDKRIETQSKIIGDYKLFINTMSEKIIELNKDWVWIKLSELTKSKKVILKRGNVIPKHTKDNEYAYPVYSSSVHNQGLMGYDKNFMFDKELITWSIDGGGNIFYRDKHKFSITNVCGIMELDEGYFNYRFVAEMLKYQHSKMIFDYQTKAHPSVIEKLYKLPIISLKQQIDLADKFNVFYKKLKIEIKILEKLKEQKKYLLSNMFI